MPEILELKAVGDSRKVFLPFSRDFLGTSLGTPKQITETATAFSSFLIVVFPELH